MLDTPNGSIRGFEYHNGVPIRMRNEEAVGRYFQHKGAVYVTNFHCAKLLENGFVCGTYIVQSKDEDADSISICSNLKMECVRAYLVETTKEEFDAAFVKALTSIRDTHVE